MAASMAMSWPDVVVPVLLILIWVALSPLPAHFSTTDGAKERSYDDRLGSIPNDTDEAKTARTSMGGYIMPVLIHHARILPKESRHSFRYPSIFLALNLQDLEDGSLEENLGWKRIFSWRSLSSSSLSSSTTLTSSPSSSSSPSSPSSSPSAPPQKTNKWTVTKLDPDGFGRRSFIGLEESMQRKLKASILLKLMYELRLRGYLPKGPQDGQEGISAWTEHVEQVWIVAMPSLLGMGGFNPLTVYFLYRRKEKEEKGKVAAGAATTSSERPNGSSDLWLVVLEVHNTFNERHVYICQVGKGEDEPRRRRKEYQHSWTFPRAFHVSPFNDRSGYYQLLLNDLWSGKKDETGAGLPTLDVRLLLLTEEGEEEDDDDSGVMEGVDAENDQPVKLQKKLLATLTSSKGRSSSLRPHRSVQTFTSTNMIRALLMQPFDLILPTSRIMWQAAKLHWKRRLPVYIRPEQRGEGVAAIAGSHDGVDAGAADEHKSDGVSFFDGVGWPVDLNPTQPSKTASSSSGAIYWNEDGFIEKACMEQFLVFLCRQTKFAPDMSINIVSLNAETSPIHIYHGQRHPKPVLEDVDTHTNLTFYALSSALALHFALFTPSQARLFGSVMDRAWGVNSMDTYDRLFSSSQTTRKCSSRKVKLAAWTRQAHMRWALEEDGKQASQWNAAQASIAEQLVADASAAHPYDSDDVSLSFVIALFLHYILLRLTASVSSLLNIRYVRAPWASVAEGYQQLCQASDPQAT